MTYIRAVLEVTNLRDELHLALHCLHLAQQASQVGAGCDWRHCDRVHVAKVAIAVQAVAFAALVRAKYVGLVHGHEMAVLCVCCGGGVWGVCLHWRPIVLASCCAQTTCRMWRVVEDVDV